MTQDTIEYAGIGYPVREVNGHLFATTNLLKVLLVEDTDIPVSAEAELVDNAIAYFLTPEDFNTLSDREAWVQCYDDDEDFEEED